jgi:hypothetical protein
MEVSHRFRVLKICLLGFALSICTSSPAFAAEAAIKTLDTVLNKASGDQTQSAQCADTAELNRAIEAGNSAKQALSNELTRYKNLQLALTSGLVAALLTAIGALATLFVTSRNSKAERDFKRLEVVEKGEAMRSKGIEIPPDIAQEYLTASQRPPEK